MSTPPSLAEVVPGTTAYLVSVTAAGAPHVAPVRPVLRDEIVTIPAVGRRSAANLGGTVTVSVVWPPTEPGGYTLIVDGVPTLDGDRVDIRPTRAVLHRPADAPGGAADGCIADCVEVDVG